MKSTVALSIFFLLVPFLLPAQEGEFAVSRIPDSLLRDANAVVRLQETSFEIKSMRETVQTERYVVTILNEKGERWAEFFEYYDKYRDIAQVQGMLYDANGKLIRKVRKKDIGDFSAVAESNLMDDNRIKRYKFFYKIYPYTVEFVTEIRNSGTLFFPVWVPQPSEGISVQKASLQVISDDGYRFRFKELRYGGKAEINGNTTTWRVANMPAFTRVPYSLSWQELTTAVLLGPTDFQIDNYKGNMASWQDFGKFIFALKQGRDQLPENIRQVVHGLTDSLKDTREKIKTLYEYMQRNTRYVSIQLGIGGWQPFDAKYVAGKGYGDCKALTNYMYSLLKEAGIASYYTLVRAGRYANYMTADFPSQQFNHVILAVPVGADTTWLECTDQTLPAGYLSEFTANRYALLVDESGGRLVRTPEYGLKENTQQRSIVARLEEDGNLQLVATTYYSGMQQDQLHGMISHLSKESVREYLQEQLDFASYAINHFDYQQQKGSLPVMRERLDIAVSNYATFTGKRLFITPNIMNRSYQRPGSDTLRRYDIQLGYASKDIDSVEIALPPGYVAESIPEPVVLETRFGKYSCRVNLRGDKLFYYREIALYSGRYPASDYNELVRFYDAIYRADRNRVVLVKP